MPLINEDQLIDSTACLWVIFAVSNAAVYRYGEIRVIFHVWRTLRNLHLPDGGGNT